MGDMSLLTEQKLKNKGFLYFDLSAGTAYIYVDLKKKVYYFI